MAGDPLTTAVGAKVNGDDYLDDHNNDALADMIFPQISAATDEGLLMEDWALNMEVTFNQSPSLIVHRSCHKYQISS